MFELFLVIVAGLAAMAVAATILRLFTRRVPMPTVPASQSQPRWRRKKRCKRCHAEMDFWGPPENIYESPDCPQCGLPHGEWMKIPPGK